MQKQKLHRHTASYTKHKLVKKSPNRLMQGFKFLPAVLFFAASVSLHVSDRPKTISTAHRNVLSYATSMSVGDLLAQSNTQRTNNGVTGLSLNSKLVNAAQTKANDMVIRNYWSHVTPTGEEPWVFITNAGYEYQTAGENLAYGFANGSDTVTGWMNSAPHRENLLNSAFSEVGFGFANSANYVNDGQQTVVVAMYGAPLSHAQSAPAPVTNNAAPTATQPTPTPQTHTNNPPRAVQPTPETQAPIPTPTQTTTTTSNTANTTKSSDKLSTPTIIVPTKSSASVRKIQLLTGGYARWSATVLVTAICGVGIVWALERRRLIKRYARVGERFILKHLHIDLAVAGFITLGLTLLQTSGLVR